MKYLRLLMAACLTGLCCSMPAPVEAGHAPALPPLPEIDKRPRQRDDDAAAPATAEVRARAVGRLRGKVRGVRVSFDPVSGAPLSVAADGAFLTGPAGSGLAAASLAAQEPADVHRVTKAFVGEHRELFGHGPEALGRARITREFVAPHNGLRTVTWQQQVRDIPVWGALLTAHTTRDDALVSLGSRWVPDPEAAAAKGTPGYRTLAARPPVEAAQAVSLAAASVGETREALVATPAGEAAAGAEQRRLWRAAALVGEAETRLVWLPFKTDELRLCWAVVLTGKTRREMYQVLVDARSGSVLIRQCLTEYISNSTYRVFLSDSPSPFSPGHPTPRTNQPPTLARSLVTLSALVTNASPNGWINDGVNETRGNNVDAHLDRNDDNQPDLPRPQGAPGRLFDFPLNLDQDPTNSSAAAVVQLFYWNNWMHDRLYELGFTEAAGNFQVDNFGRGGIGNDPVMADAQDGGGFNNANMSTPPDGSSARMQMYLFDGPSPRRDGDLDAEVILHEYTHGLSNRRVGGGAGLTALQSRGMGEGWSDFYAMALLSEVDDNPGESYATGGFLAYELTPTYRENYYFGIRRYPYSTDLNRNPLTFKDIDPAQDDRHSGVPQSPLGGGSADQVHNQGEVWCVTLWEMRANLISRHGAAAGNRLALQLVTDGMALTPANPNFIQARDAILQAELVNTGGTNRNELWAAFAKRGLGFSASSPPSSTTAGVQEAFDLPDSLRITPGQGMTSRGEVGGPFAPVSTNLTLLNIGTNALNWSLVNTSTWLTVMPASGSLLPGGAATVVTATVQTAATTLPRGIHSATVRFLNLGSAVVQERHFRLRVGQPDYLTELFATGNNDLAFQTFTFTPYNGVNGYTACRETATLLPTDPAGGTPLSLTDDSSTPVVLAGGATIALHQRRTNIVHVGSNGYLTLDAGDDAYTESIASHFRLPRVSALFSDLSPAVNGSISWRQLSNRLAVTYFNIQEYGTAATNTFQIEMFFDGQIRLTYLDIGTRDGLVGLSAGQGSPVDFESSDYSRYDRCSPPLAVSIPATATEGGGGGVGRVSLPAAVGTNVTVLLASGTPAEINVPASVTISAGATNTTFPVIPGDDAVLDGSQSVVITATASGFRTGEATIVVHDNESASLQLVFPGSVTEGSGPVNGRITLSAPPATGIIVGLRSANPAAIQVPATVSLPAGQTEITFGAVIPDNFEIESPRSVELTAHVVNWIDGHFLVTVIDDESRELHLTLPAFASEAAGVLAGAGRVSLGGVLPTNLVVTLSSADPTELTVPPTVTIPAFQSDATFDLTLADEPDADGLQLVDLTAAAAGFTEGRATIQVTDDESPALPLLRIQPLSVMEGDDGPTLALFDVSLVPASAAVTVVGYQTGDLTARAGSDYQATNGVLVFGPGEMNRQIAVWIHGDTNAEPNETLLVTLAPPTNALIGTGAAVGNIRNDDLAAVGRILLFYDSSPGSGPFAEALTRLRLPFDYFGPDKEAQFSTAVRTAPPESTLVIVDAGRNPHDFTSVAAFVEAGGRAVLSYWNLDAAATLAAAFEVAVTADRLAAAPVFDWESTPLFDALPNPLEFLDTTADDGDTLRPLGDAVGAAGWETSPSTNAAALVVGNSGRTIVNGFLLGEIDPVADATRLAENEIMALVSGRRSNSPPAILTQPEGKVRVVGGSVRFDARVSGTRPLAHQWLRNGIPLPERTNASLNLSNLTLEAAGSYSVEVRNRLGSTVSSNAVLTVVAAPPSVEFRIVLLLTNNSQVVDHNLITGDDRGGIAASSFRILYSGDLATARFSTLDLSAAGSVGTIYDALASDLQGGRIYSLGTSAGPLDSAGGTVTRLLEHDGISGLPNGAYVTLSTPVNVPANGGNVGIFAGYGRIAIHTGSAVHEVAVPSGIVTFHGLVPVPVHQSTESWAYWGVAEFFDGRLHLVYARDHQTIVRTRVPDGATSVVGSFSDLSDLAAFTVSVPQSRWIFHYEGSGQFGGTSETLGSADAVFSVGSSNRPAIVVPPGPQSALVGDTVRFSAAVSGSSPLFYRWRKNGVDLPSGTNEVLTMADVQLTHAGSYSVVVSNSIGRAVSSGATLTVATGLSLAEAVDAPLLSWASGGADRWRGQVEDNRDGVDAAASGTIGDDAESWLETTLTNGPGTVSFWWKVSCETDFDFLQFETNGVSAARITGEQDWVQVSIPVAGGPQLLRWRYQKDEIYDGGRDRGWLDQFVFTPSLQGAPVIIQFPADRTVAAGESVSFSPAVAGSTPRSYRWWKDGMPLASGSNLTLSLPGVQVSATGAYRLSVSNAFGAVTSPAVVLTVLASLPLAEAVDAPDWTWTTGGAAGWSGITATTHDGVDAGTSGPIPNAADSWIQTTVIEGPATVAFWWKVSSEATYDELTFETNGIAAAAISGEHSWTRRTFRIAAGPQQLRWRYRKDTSVSAGADRGWLDQFTLTPDHPVAPLITTSPVGRTVAAGRSVTLSVGASGTRPLTYHWHLNGIPIGFSAGSNLTLNAVTESQAGIYSVVVGNAAGTATSPGALLAVGQVRFARWENPEPITAKTNAGSPYPSQIIITGWTGPVNHVSVTLSNLTHSAPRDLDILLVGPRGQKVMLMSDTVGNSIYAFTNLTLTFDSRAISNLPLAGLITSGSYRPTDLTPGDSLPVPAPAAPYSTDLGVFNQSDPTGPWSLYVADDLANLNFGTLANGWSLALEVLQPTLRIVPAGGGWALQWSAGFPGQIEAAPGIPEGWSLLPLPPVVPQSNGFHRLNVPATGAQQFFRWRSN